jgi:predicted AlkP superfamily pyrophosphatase or phosphodiesterase
MSSIAHGFGKKHSYPELRAMSSDEIKKFKNVVLIVVDGLGYNYLKEQRDSFLSKNIKSCMDSTFLSTTACANTAFAVGYPAQQHGLTAWDINLKEVGAITTILPFVPMCGGKSLTESGFKMDKIMDIESFHKGFNGKCFILFDKLISDSPFTNYVAKGAEVISTKNNKDMFAKLTRLVKKKSIRRRFIHAYLPELDSMMHDEGTDSKKVRTIFSNFDKLIKNLANAIKGTNTKLIVVADHGLTNIPKEKEIFLNDIDGLSECFTIAPAGEPRVMDCFVRPGKVKEFEEIVKSKLSKYCWCFKGEQLIKDNFYGLGEPSKRLIDRVGDYVLIAKEDYSLRYRFANYTKPKKYHSGKHGGVSDNERLVPLITIDC